MVKDIHYLAQEYLNELEMGISMSNPVRERREAEEEETYILLRNNTYFYGHHPRTGKAIWTHDALLAQVLTLHDAAQLSKKLIEPIQTIPAPKRGEAHF